METTESLSGWAIRGKAFAWGSRTYIMGILNVTPDSFSDGGDFFECDRALVQAQEMRAWDVDIIDIGGQSSRPDADEIPLQAELKRVIPVIQAIRGVDDQTPISIDTTRSEVAQAAIAAGADLINDISGGLEDPRMFSVAAKHQVPMILMHRRGNAKTMQSMTTYGDLVAEVMEFLDQQLQAAVKAGVDRQQLAVDPGIGFAKTFGQNIQLLQSLRRFQRLGAPLLIGTSRKSFIGQILNEPDPKQRVWGTAASCCTAIAQGADILRVHDVPAMTQVSRVADAFWRSGGGVL